MLSSDQNVEQITKLVGEAKDYVKLRGKLWRLLFIEKSSVLLSGLLTAVLALVLCFFAVGMLSVCAALLLSPVVGSLAGACAIVAAAYLVVLLIVYLNRTNWIVNPVTSFVARTIINATRKVPGQDEPL
ncbi:MAG: phage holin family protein [Alloprevotella sp.]|nr:phage holin family protein [Alloprevotella sp.]